MYIVKEGIVIKHSLAQQLLGSTTKKIYLSSYFDFLSWSEEDKVIYAIQTYLPPRIPLSPEDKVTWVSMVLEYTGIRLRQKEGMAVSDYQIGLKKLFQALLLASDKEDLPEESDAIIREAGQLLHNSGGMQDMLETLIWVPKVFHRNIDLLWNGIGNWRG